MPAFALVAFLAAVAGWWLAFKFVWVAERQSAEIAALRRQVYEAVRGVPGLAPDPEPPVELTRAEEG